MTVVRATSFGRNPRAAAQRRSELAKFEAAFDRNHFLDRDALVATLSKSPTYPY